MNTDPRKEYSVEYFLSAAECNAQQEISLPLLAQKFIDISTAHANFIDVGYERLLRDNAAWVLSRITVEVDRMPRINERITLTTWIQEINRHYSERIIEVSDAEGNPIGYGRLVWVGINIASRRPIDLSPLFPNLRISDRPCPIAKHSRLTAIGEPDHITMYNFRFSDIDFNRHVNSTRYIEFILDQWSVAFFDVHRVKRFEIAYQAEAHYDDIVEVRRCGDAERQDFEIARNGAVCTRARITFAPREA